MPIARTEKEDLPVSAACSTRRGLRSSDGLRILIAVLPIFAWLCGTLGLPGEGQAQGINGISLGNIALPTVKATPTPVRNPIPSIFAVNPTRNSLSVFATGSSGNVAWLFT